MHWTNSLGSMLVTVTVVLCALAASVRADFAHVVQDERGVYWFEQNGARFLSRVVNHVNNGGPDDGVDGRESAVCQAMTNNTLCGDSLNFGGALGYAVRILKFACVHVVSLSTPDVSHLYPSVSLQPYWNVVNAKYNGSADSWADATIDTLAALGFNGVSGWSARVAETAAARKGWASFHLLDLGVTWPFAWSKGLDFDVWSNEFSDQVERIAAEVVPLRANDESLLAWQTDNECNYMLLNLTTYLVDYATSAGGAECVRWLQSRFGTLDALNTAFNIKASAWTGVDGVGVHLLHDSNLNATALLAADIDFIANAVMDRYFNLTTSAIRKHDKNHLISGLRGYFGDAALAVITTAGKYCDSTFF